jgi:sensor histidine kinase YesM
MLRLYVHLEGLRFSNKFSFRVDVDENIDDDLLEIPSMVIQPFVENAILHGLTPKSGDDLLLTLSFEMLDKNTLCCIVEDNGIGRVASAAIKQSKQLQHHSMGLEITQQRLNLYFKETGNKFSFDIRDLKDNNNQASGTKVEIIFAV